MREHFIKLCKAMAAHHVACAKSHRAMSKQYDDGPHKKFHQDMETSHVEAGESCLQCCKAVNDGDESEPSNKTVLGSPMRLAQDLDKMVPTQARGVMPDVPAATLVPRFGSAPISTKDVPEEFRHLVSE